MATFEIVGIYRITPTLESIASAARYHQCDYLLDEHGNYNDEINWGSFENLALIELQVQGEFSLEDINSIGQADQAPYMEFYLDGAGMRLLSEEEATQTNYRRLCFFLHFVDLSEPLAVGPEQLKMPAMSALPDRLKPYTHFLPID